VLQGQLPRQHGLRPEVSEREPEHLGRHGLRRHHERRGLRRIAQGWPIPLAWSRTAGVTAAT
jgi:hypothetical protein